jgi:hypothetical protein
MGDCDPSTRLSTITISPNLTLVLSLANLRGRCVIAPSDQELAVRYHGTAPQVQPPALQCATLGAIGGFFDHGVQSSRLCSRPPQLPEALRRQQIRGRQTSFASRTGRLAGKIPRSCSSFPSHRCLHSLSEFRTSRANRAFRSQLFAHEFRNIRNLIGQHVHFSREALNLGFDAAVHHMI